MSISRSLAVWTITSALLVAGCGPGKQPAKTPQTPAGQNSPKTPQRPELTAPIEGALLALKAMNEAGKKRDFATAEQHFREYRKHWVTVRAVLVNVDPRLEAHLEDGAMELDVEFKKPTDQIRVYELDEETVKLGQLLSKAAKLLGTPIRAELVQVDPTEDIPFNQEKRVAMTLSDHKFQPETLEIDQHTKVTFVLTNRGKEMHEFEVGYYAVEVEDIMPGETKELTMVFLDAGDFEFACHVPGHYEVGMHGKIKVKPAELKKR